MLVADGEGLGGARKHRSGRVTRVRAVEAILDSEITHSLHGALCGVATLERHAAELINAEKAVTIVALAGRPARSLRTTRGLGNTELHFILEAVDVIPVAVCVRDLRHEPTRCDKLLVVHRLVARTARVAHDTRVWEIGQDDRTEAARRVIGGRDAHQADVLSAAAGVVVVADNSGAISGGIFADGDDGARARSAGEQRESDRGRLHRWTCVAIGGSVHGFRCWLYCRRAVSTSAEFSVSHSKMQPVSLLRVFVNLFPRS
mmetsp:Transcript_64266/g.177838  ORF Transcript_64266/g.177838 Transcript_64266/m.177838 type:complete len:260 (+) Transcript_64266:1682-2461(+)